MMKEGLLALVAVVVLYVVGIPVVYAAGIAFLGVSFSYTFRLLLEVTTVALVLEYLFVPLIIKASWKAKPLSKAKISPERKELLEALAEKYSREFGVKRLRVLVSDSEVPNAFAISHPLYGNWIVFTKSILDRLDDEEVEAVFLHELGHIKHLDSYLMLLMLFPIAVVEMLMRISFWDAVFRSSNSSKDSDSTKLDPIFGLLLMPIYIAMVLLYYGMSRRRERLADGFSKRVIGSGGPLATALVKVHYAMFSHQGVASKAESSRLKALFFASPLAEGEVPPLIGIPEDPDELRDVLLAIAAKGGRRAGLFSTHPSVYERIRYLLQ